MIEKPGLEPGFFCSTNCWRLDGLRVASGLPRTTEIITRARLAWFVPEVDILRSGYRAALA
jgi:hypothetical protein